MGKWASGLLNTVCDVVRSVKEGIDALLRKHARTRHAVLDTSRSVGGKPTTLASLGYSYVSMDGAPTALFRFLPVVQSCRTVELG